MSCMLSGGGIGVFIRAIPTFHSLQSDTLKKESERRDGVSKPRSGRPKKLTEADKDLILNAVRENPKITAEELLAKVDHKVTYRSITRLLNAENIRK